MIYIVLNDLFDYRCAHNSRMHFLNQVENYHIYY